MRTTDRYAASPFGGDFLFFDVVVGLVCGTVVSVIAMLFGVVGVRYAKLRAIADRRLFIAIIAFYAVVTIYLCTSTPLEPGNCRLDL